jgi:hypothetical protein
MGMAAARPRFSPPWPRRSVGRENENAFIMAIDPSLVHPERYTKEMVTANPSQGTGTWTAYPNPSSITLYKDGQGYLKFDQAKAKTYFAKVNEKLTINSGNDSQVGSGRALIGPADETSA